MNYIVLDLEWNQCPDGKEQEEPNLPFEIIEIGAVRIDESHTVIDSFHEIIAPQVYKKLHFMTREVILLNERDFADKRTFPEVMHDFWEWCGADARFCIWGSTDLLELQRNLAWHHMENPFSFPLFYYDIQKIFSIVYEDRKTRRSLEAAVDLLHIPKPDAFHNAYTDACYTAKIMKHLTDAQILTNSSVDYYRTPKNRRQEFTIAYPAYSKFVSKPFRNKTDAMKDRNVVSTECYLCHQKAPKKIRWFSGGGRNYFCLAQCETHGWLKGKIRMRQHTDGTFYVIKTIKRIDESGAQAIHEKQEIVRIRRKNKS